MSERRAVLATAVRSPFGKNRGGLSGIRPDDLLGLTIAELVSRVPNLDPALIDDVLMGDSNGAGEDNRNVARMAALLAGLPVTVPGVTINRLCGSGAEAVVQAARAVRAGDIEIAIAGGVESMSRAPYVLPKSERPLDAMKLEQTTVGWRMVNPAFPAHWTDSLGTCAQRSADARGIGRTAQDEWAVRSHERAAAAWAAGLHQDYVFAVNGVEMDESIRPSTTMETLGALKPAFQKDGTVTAGNSSPINDGAVATLITSSETASDLGLEALATIRGAVVVATEPDDFASAPVPAMRKLLAREGLSFSDIARFEINEAFAAMVLTVLHDLPEIPHDRVNPDGGAIAIGHPVGASAARVIADTARGLRRTGGGLGIATACIGVGLGIAVLVEVS
jgi:acetyl-CoA acetyltransferase family protein